MAEVLGDDGTGGDEDFRDAVSRVHEEWGETPRTPGSFSQGTSAVGAFRRVYRRALYLAGLQALLLVLAFVTISIASSGLAVALAFFWMFAFIAALVGSVVNWRCPVCGGYLGKGFWGMFSVSHCIRCGARLK